jgi:hypothetical protein
MTYPAVYAVCRLLTAISLFAVLSFNAATPLATATSLAGTISDSSGKVIPNV